MGLAIGAFGCADSPAIDGPPVHPGDSWLDREADVRLLAISLTNLPAGIPENALRLLHERTETVRPEDWVRAGETIWRYAPTLDFGLALGPQWLAYRGAQVVPSGRILEDTRELVRWHDEKKDLYVNWNPDDDLFRAHQKRPTSALEFGFADHRNAVHSLIERPDRIPKLQEADASARGLIGRATFRDEGADTRTVLYAPAPSRYRFDTASFQADRLSFAVHTLEYGIHWDAKKRQLQRSDPNPGDGTTFAIEVWTGEKMLRVWSQHVAAEEGFVEAEVDLRAYRDGPLRIELVTEAGPAGDALCDYGVWSGLRFQGGSRAKPERPHILLIDIDTLRADRMSVYGHRRDTTPRLQKWANENALIYEHSAAASTWTLPSTASMLTGLTLTQHDVAFAPDALQAAHRPIASRLKAEGYETRARVEGGYLEQRFGFDLGFDRYRSHRPGWRKTLEQGWKEELEFLRKRESDRPLFFLLQTYITHDPHAVDRRYEDPGQPRYEGPFFKEGAMVYVERVAESEVPLNEDDWRFANNVYDASVARMDDLVMDFIDGLEEVFADEPFLLIFSSDHGEEFNDHGGFGHGRALYEETTRVPLIVRFPDKSRVGRSREPTSGLDLVPTMLDFAGAPGLSSSFGVSLRNEVAMDRVRIAEQRIRNEKTQTSFWRAGKKFILDGRSGDELFDLSDDPQEQVNLAPENPKAMREVRQRFQEHVLNFPKLDRPEEKRRHLSQSLRAELEALGYAVEE